MEKKNLLVMILVIAIAASGVIGFLYARGSIKLPLASQTPSCPAPSLVYVYDNEQQKNAADAVTSTFKTVLNNYGINIINMPVCSISSGSLPHKLRIYPALLYKGDIPALSQYTVGSIGDYKILAPTISATFAYYNKVNITFGATAEALIVESRAPYAKLNISDKDLRDLLSQVAVANITKITRVTQENAGVNVPYSPAILFRSDYNLSQGVSYLVRLKDNIYTVSNQTQRSLAQYLGLTVYETRIPPDQLLDEGISYGAKNKITLYILEDYHCPFCADLMNNLGNYLQSLVRQEQLRLVLVDLIVHPEVASMHALTKCIYNITGNSEIYFNISRELYMKGTSTTLNDTQNLALKYIPQQVLSKALVCSNTSINTVQFNSQALQNLGYTGTPTLIFWNNEARKGLVIEGCLQVHPCLTEEQLSNILNWLRS